MVQNRAALHFLQSVRQETHRRILALKGVAHPHLVRWGVSFLKDFGRIGRIRRGRRELGARFVYHQEIDGAVSVFPMDFQLKTVRQKSSEHFHHLAARGIALGLGLNVEPVGVEPSRAPDDLEVFDAVGLLHYEFESHVRHSKPAPRVDSKVDGLPDTWGNRLDRYNVKRWRLVLRKACGAQNSRSDSTQNRCKQKLVIPQEPGLLHPAHLRRSFRREIQTAHEGIYAACKVYRRGNESSSYSFTIQAPGKKR